MAEWHLRALEKRLTQRGWQVASGKANGRSVAETWEITRGDVAFQLELQADPEAAAPEVETATRCRSEAGRAYASLSDWGSKLTSPIDRAVSSANVHASSSAAFRTKAK